MRFYEWFSLAFYVLFGALAYVLGNFALTEYLLLPFVPGAGELLILFGAVIGAYLGATEQMQG